MLILDSNVWIYAITADERPIELETEALGIVRLFDDLLDGKYDSLVTPYMAVEIEHGCERSDRVPSANLDATLTELYGLLGTCESIRTPFDTDDLGETTLSEQRERTCNRLVGELLDIQTKDVPVFLPAYDHYTDNPVVLTADAEFANLNPHIHDLSNVTVEGLDITWGV